jgi:very-short-patch-repair endonuclease
VKSTASGTTIKRARQLRRTMTLPEVLLWSVLRTRPDNFKFRRQHPAGPFIADFYCDAAQLIIEIDGVAHSMGRQPEHDEQRDAYFARIGIQTLRISAEDVLKDLDGVLLRILNAANQRQPLHHTSCGPPPPVGEEFMEA